MSTSPCRAPRSRDTALERLGAVRGTVALLLVAACGPSSAERQAACEARVLVLEARLAGLSEPGPALPSIPGLEVATATGADATRLLPVIGLSRDGELRLDDRALGGPDALAADVATLDRNWAILHPRSTGLEAVYVWADRRMSLADVRAATALLRPDLELWLLAESAAARSPAPVCPAGHETTCAALAAPDGEARATRLATAWQDAIGSCAELVRLSGELASADPAARLEVMRTGVPAALRACGCVGGGLDVELVAYLTEQILAPRGPRATARRLGPAGESDASTSVEAFFAAPQ